MNHIRQSAGQLFKPGGSQRFPLCLLLCVTGLQNAGAADIVVANNADSGNGTLRQAIQFNESLGGGNTIIFSSPVTGTITLTNVLGELLITKDVTIIGPGAKVLAISGNETHRVFHLTSNANVSISGLTITGGHTSGGDGAGILQDSGTLGLSDCIVSSNRVNTGQGGGILANGTVLATRCTVSENFSSTGGGIDAGGTFTAINCTVSGNVALASGGGIFQSAGSLFLTNCTISGNRCGNIGIGTGGGISKSGGSATLRNTIVAGNLPLVRHPDCSGTFTSGGFNLVGAINGSTGWGALGDQVGTTNSYLNPMLGPLQDNGGPTLTMAPQFGSPVIDQANSSGSFADQRGRARPYTNDYIASIPLGGDHSDIGAYEISPITLVVSNLNDSGAGSLRQAIAAAFPFGFDTISFASNVVGTITLTTGELVIGKELIIEGPATRSVIISGNNASRVIRMANNGVASLSRLTIANGNSPAQGAGIYNDFGCHLVLRDCAIAGNISSGANGGGVANNGAFTAFNSTFSSNRAAFTGGAIYTYAGPVALYNCTVGSNSTVSADGGGICSYSPQPGTSAYLASTIVAGNSAPGHADVIGVFGSGGHNLIGKIDYSTPGGGAAAGVPTSGLTNGSNHDLVGSAAAPIDPKIGPLQNNGGPTPTMGLLANSPALDQGLSNGQTTDQRGAPRPFDFALPANPGGGDGSDIGAFELGRPPLNIQKFTTDAVLSWPFYYGDFTVESVTNIILSNAWTTVAGLPVVSGTQYVLTNGPITGHKFYRLKAN